MKLLIVDDSKTVAEVIDVMVTVECESIKDRVETIWAADGVEGLTKIKEEGDSIDVIILDWNMPVMNGYTFLQKMDENRDYRFPIIVMVSEPNLKFMALEFKNIMINFLEKPFSREVLNNKITEIIDKMTEKKFQSKA